MDNASLTSIPLPVKQILKLGQEYADRVYLRQSRNGQWFDYTYRDVANQVKIISSFLIRQGLNPGDKVAIFGQNSVEWMISDWAISLAGCVAVPIFDTHSPESTFYILKHSDARAVFIGKVDNFLLVKHAISKKLLRIAFPYPELELTGDFYWQDIIEKGQTRDDFPDVTHQDLMHIIYTGGIDGSPKGVMLNYQSYISSVFRTIERYGKNCPFRHERLFCYIPLAQLITRGFTQTCNFR